MTGGGQDRRRRYRSLQKEKRHDQHIRTAPDAAVTVRALVAALAAAEAPISLNQGARWIAKNIGLRLDRRTLSAAANELARSGHVAAFDDDGQPRRWALAEPGRTV